MGRSSILLGYLYDGACERLVVSDLFEDEETTEESKAWRARRVGKPRREDFIAQYLRFHRGLPEIIAGPSLELDLEVLGLHRFRLVHVDGAHDWTNIDADLRIAERLTSDDGLLVFDDVCNPAFPAVAARIWSEVVAGRLFPIAVTGKLYATKDPGSVLVEALRSRIQEAADLSARVQTIAASEVLVVTDIDDTPVSPPSPRSPSWKRVVRDLAPPIVYRGASRLANRTGSGPSTRRSHR
jgi:hypothetical protein